MGETGLPACYYRWVPPWRISLTTHGCLGHRLTWTFKNSNPRYHHVEVGLFKHALLMRWNSLSMWFAQSWHSLYSHCLPEKCQRKSEYKVVYQRKRDFNLLSKLQNLLPFKWLPAQVILATLLTESLLSKKVITKTCIGGQSIQCQVNLTRFGKASE